MGILKTIKDFCCCLFPSCTSENRESLLGNENGRLEQNPPQALTYGGIGGTFDTKLPESSYAKVTNFPSPKTPHGSTTSPQRRQQDVHTTPKRRPPSQQDTSGNSPVNFKTPPRQETPLINPPGSGGSDLSFAHTPSP